MIRVLEFRTYLDYSKTFYIFSYLRSLFSLFLLYYVQNHPPFYHDNSAKKRFRVTANAGLKAGHAGRRHLNRNKTRKVLNNMRKDMHLSGANLRNMRRLLQMPNR